MSGCRPDEDSHDPDTANYRVSTFWLLARNRVPMARQFQVSCEDCSFEEAANSRTGAEGIARRHSARTDHDVVALERPATN